MAEAKTTSLFARFDQAEFTLCLLVNRAAQRRAVWTFFAAISRLGNGAFWYTLLAALPLAYGPSAVPPTVHMVLVGLVGVAVYKAIKHRLMRERPYVSWPAIRCRTPPLDRYSFPSGHTLHATAFSVLTLFHFPELGWLVVPFALLVATSRVMLGLHYPSDVAAGAAIGGGLASAGIYLLDAFQ